MNIFNFVHKNFLIYNTCWEDPRIDKVALELTSQSRVLVITSAGCNALDYLISSDCSIHAVDMNKRQNALLDLKLSAAKALSFEQYFDLFGKGKIKDTACVLKKINPFLSEESKTIWKELFIKYFGSGKSFYFRGSSGFFAKLVNLYIDQKPKLREGIERLFNSSSIEEQREIFFREVEPLFWSKSLRWFLSKKVVLALVGVPESQKKYVEEYHGGGVVGFIEDCLRKVFTTIPIKDNYFWRVYLTGSYTEDCCPLYLTKNGYEKIRELDSKKIKIFTGSISQYLEQSPDNFFTHYVLLDHMDWLYQNKKAELAKEWELIEQKSLKPTRIIWRSGGKETEFVKKIRLGTGQLGDRLSFIPVDDRLDRVSTYASFSVCDLR